MPSDHPAGLPGITVVGLGSAPTAVDHVTLTLGVEIVRADAGDAFRTAAATATAVLAVLSDNGVQSRAVRTADLSLGPRYDYRGNEQVLVGYQAAQRLIVSLEGLNSVDRMLSDLVARAGDGLRIEQVALTAGNPREAESDARTAAMIDAREKATQLATLAGRGLGQIDWVQEQPASGPSPVALMAYRSSADAAMPVVAGDTSVTVSLQVRFCWAG